MDAITLLIIAGFIHCLLFFFNIIFRSCSHYPYLYFLQNTGLEIQTLCVKWSTTAFNRAIVRLGLDRSKFWSLWFNLGAIASIILLPVASFLVATMTIRSWSSGARNVGSEPVLVLVPMLPGVNVPLSDIGYHVITLGACSIFHEFGHALAASREDVQLFGVGILVAYIVPVAYVSMSTEQLNSLPVVNQLRVLCAGIWHNIVLAALSAIILVLSAWFWAPLYTFGSGVTVKSITPNSPLLGPTGLLPQDTIYVLNDCPIVNSDSWYRCILEAVNQPTPGYCVAQSLIREYDESTPARTLPNGAVNCCSLDSETSSSLCFEYMEGPQSAPLQLPPHSCLPARTIIDGSHRYCQPSYHCPSQGTHCMRPSFDNTTKLSSPRRQEFGQSCATCRNGLAPKHLWAKTLLHRNVIYPPNSVADGKLPSNDEAQDTGRTIYDCICPPVVYGQLPLGPSSSTTKTSPTPGQVVQLKRRVGKDVLFIGHPADIYRTVEVSDWVPKYKFLSPNLPESQTLLCKYTTILSAGLAVVNVVPCFFFDGQHIVNVLTQFFLRSRVRRKSLRHAIALTVTCIGTLILVINMAGMLINS